MDVVARVLAGVGAILLLRALAVKDFAYVVLFLAVGQFIGTAATGGVRMRHLRMEAERVSRGTSDPAAFTTALAGGTLVIVAIAVVGLPLAAIAGLGDSLDQLALFVGLVAGFAAGQAASELVIFHLQAHLKFVAAGAVGVARAALLATISLGATIGALRSGVATAAALTIAALGVAVAGAWRPSAAAVKNSRRRLERRLGFGAESGWLTIYYVASAGFANTEIFVVAAILDKVDVATFGAAQRYYAVVLGAGPALLAVLRVRTSQRDIVDSPVAQRALLTTWAKRTALPVGVGVAAVGLAAPYLIPLVDGGRYPQSIPVFQILLVAAFFLYVTIPASNLLMAQRRYRTLALVLGAGVTATTTGDLIGGALFGVVGVAVTATVVTSLISLEIARLALARAPETRPPIHESRPIAQRATQA
jgi:O-antigen/teichoic acid export membrane protein